MERIIDIMVDSLHYKLSVGNSTLALLRNKVSQKVIFESFPFDPSDLKGKFDMGEKCLKLK